MMGRTNWLIFWVLLALITGTFLYRKGTSTPDSSIAERQESLAAPRQAAAGTARVGLATPAPSRVAPTAGGPTVREVAPTAGTLRDEVRDNPHRTPPSLIQFARSLAPRMESALQSPDSAASLLSEFDECAHDGNLSSTVQAVCLQNSARLARRHPSLQSRYQAVFDGAPADARELVNRMNTLASGAR